MIETFHLTDQNTSVEIKHDLLWKQTVICFLDPFQLGGNVFIYQPKFTTRNIFS